jgi:hypothetical protein
MTADNEAIEYENHDSARQTLADRISPRILNAPARLGGPDA